MINSRPGLYFELNSIWSNTPAWSMTNLLELTKPATKRGSNPIIIPGTAGVIVTPLRKTVTERVVTGLVFGRFNPDGVPYASQIDGLRSNLDLLAAAWGTVPDTDDSTMTITLHQTGHDDVAGPVRVLDLDWDWADMPVIANLVMRLQLPLGQLE